MFVGKEALEAAIRRHIEATNADPHPFVWTQSADEILDSVRRFCRRTTDISKRQETSNSAYSCLLACFGRNPSGSFRRGVKAGAIGD